MKSQPSPYRLPKNVIPERYEIGLAPDLESKTSKGSVLVDVRVVEPTSEIWLNAAELEVKGALIFNREGIRLEGDISLDEENERCHLTFPEILASGDWKLILMFKGTLNDKLRGFYHSTYKDAEGATHAMAATQCEATDARRIFPCWDEPAFKAVFSVTLGIDPALTAVSNTAIISENIVGNNVKAVRFHDTIKMSTYLFALVVGEMEATEAIMVGQTPIRIWCVPGKRRLTSFAHSFGAGVLAFFEYYYGVPYPGDKLDLLAIPDFAAGAMENLGAITFRETALLVDEASATHAEIARVADVVAHEEAHMWFGDLVTMRWWNGIWLNEAFATFMEMLAVDNLKPEWRRWESFGVSRAAAFAVDGLHSTRPIEFTVGSPRDADAMFDILTYEKGAAVLRMLEQFLGPDVFRDGVRGYLSKHAYANTETVDLWNALGGAAGIDVATLMNNWIFKPGYPVVSVDFAFGELILQQQRFTYLPEPLENVPGRTVAITTSTQDQIWQIPVQIRAVRRNGGEEIQRVLFSDREIRVALPNDTCAVVVNEGGHGFYRVRYSRELLGRLQNRLGYLSPIERFNLVEDVWAAVKAGLMPIDEYLDFIMRFRYERSQSVWTVIIGSLSQMRRIVGEADRLAYELMVQNCLRDTAYYLGWEPQPGDDDLTRQLRGEILLALGILGNDRSTQEHAEEVYRAYQAGNVAVDPNVLKAVVHILASVGNAVRYEEFLVAFRNAKTPQEEQRFLYALTFFKDPELVERTLEKTLNGEIRTQDAHFVLRSMLLSMHSRGYTWDFIRANWDAMWQKYGQKLFKRTMEGLRGLATPEFERSVWEFLAENNADFGGLVLEQQLEELRIMVTLRGREGNRLSAYLNR